MKNFQEKERNRKYESKRNLKLIRFNKIKTEKDEAKTIRPVSSNFASDIKKINDSEIPYYNKYRLFQGNDRKEIGKQLIRIKTQEAKPNTNEKIVPYCRFGS